MRVDLYTLIHKAQRYHLFRLSEEIGKVDWRNGAVSDAVGKRTLNLMEHLKDHALNENTYIHPLYQAIGALGEHFGTEHDQLDQEIQKIERIVAEKRWSNLYSEYTRFLGVYLLHLDEEEAAQRDVLWKHYDDAELAKTFNRFKAERPPDLAKADFEFMLPAMSIPELTNLFQGIKASAPTGAYQGACELASRILAEEDWHKVSQTLG